MESRSMELTLISFRDLNNPNLFSNIKVYAVAWISNDPKNEQITPLDKDNGTDPTWNQVMRFTLDEAALQQRRLFLEIEIRTEATVGYKEIGRVTVPLNEFLRSTGGNRGATTSAQSASYQVREPGGNAKGVLELSVKLAEKPEGKQQQYQPQAVAELYGAGKAEHVAAYRAGSYGAANAERVTAYGRYPLPSSFSQPPPYTPPNNQYLPPPYPPQTAHTPPPPCHQCHPPPPYPPQAAYTPPPPCHQFHPPPPYPPQAAYTPPPPCHQCHPPPPYPPQAAYTPPPPPNQGYPPIFLVAQDPPRNNNRLGMVLGTSLFVELLGNFLAGQIGGSVVDGGDFWGGGLDGGF